ncbi:MAG TPA: PorT family protein [Saprospiraceae bacterium]|nr:PorT family protein [Saprospiraceae bacterium]
MKNLRNAIIAVIILMTIQAQAQVKIGVLGGINASQFNMPLTKELGVLSIKKGVGTTVGIFATTPVYGALSIRTEANYMVRNYSVKIDPSQYEATANIPFNLTANLKSKYYEIPVMFQVDLGQGPVGAYLIGGAALSGYMNSQLGVGVLGTQLLRIPISNIGFRKTEWSAIGGAGMRVDVGFGDLILEGRYQAGLTDLVTIPALQGVNLTPKNRNNSFVFKAGVAIPLSRTAKTRYPVAYR